MKKFSESKDLTNAINALVAMGNLQPSTAAPAGLATGNYARKLTNLLPSKYNGKINGLRAVATLDSGVECFCSCKGSKDALLNATENQSVNVTVYEFPEDSGNLYSKVVL